MGRGEYYSKGGGVEGGWGCRGSEVYASILVHLSVLFIKWRVISRIILLVMVLKDGLPKRRILVRWSWGKFKISSLTAMATLLSRVWREEAWVGQRSRKCSFVSGSESHLQVGLMQLKL